MADLHLVQRPISALPILAKIPIPGSPDWVGIGNGAVWISNIDKNNISRIDPTKNKVVANITVGKAPCSGLGIGFGSIWVPCCGSARVDRVDATTNHVVASIATTIADSEGAIGVGDSGVWMPADQQGTVIHIDPATNEIIGTVDTVPGSVAAAVRRRMGDEHRTERAVPDRSEESQSDRENTGRTKAALPGDRRRCGVGAESRGRLGFGRRSEDKPGGRDHSGGHSRQRRGHLRGRRICLGDGPERAADEDRPCYKQGGCAVRRQRRRCGARRRRRYLVMQFLSGGGLARQPGLLIWLGDRNWNPTFSRRSCRPTPVPVYCRRPHCKRTRPILASAMSAFAPFADLNSDIP